MRVSEIGVLYSLPQLAPHVRRWWQKKSHSAPTDDPRRTARRVLRRSTNVARRGGLITGSSFYVGMVPAMAMIYCEQLVIVLRIAAVFGRDPTDPVRAARDPRDPGPIRHPRRGGSSLGSRRRGSRGAEYLSLIHI